MGEAAKIQIMKSYDANILKLCRELDRKVYKDEYVSDFEEESALIKKNPRSRIVAWYQGELTAYYEYTPLTEAAFDRFINTKDALFDLSLSEEDISPWIAGKPVDVYVGSIVVNPDYQGKMLSIVLMRGLWMSFKELENEGYVIGRVGGTGVSSGGVYSLKTYLDLKISHEVPGGTAMYGSYEDAINCLDQYVGF